MNVSAVVMDDYRRFLAHYGVTDDVRNRAVYEDHVAKDFWPYTVMHRCGECGFESENPDAVRYCEATHQVSRRCDGCGGSGVRSDHVNNSFVSHTLGYTPPRCERCGGSGRTDERVWQAQVRAIYERGQHARAELD